MASNVTYGELTEERKEKILEKNGPIFLKKIDPDIHLLTNLVSKEVITSEEKQDILDTEGHARRKDKLLTRLIHMALLPFIIFCIFLCDDMNRRDIVEYDWGLSLHHLKMQRDEMMNRQWDQCTEMTNITNRKHWRWTTDFNKGLTSHREFYQRELMKGRLFDIKDLNLGYNRDYDMERCFIQIVATSDELVSKPEKIYPEEMLKAKTGKARPRTALLSGPPGSGKSSLIKYYVYKWSKLPNGEGEWDLIVILDVATLDIPKGGTPRDCIKEAIRQSLEGREDKEAILKSLDDDNMNILIVPDGIDECRNKTTRVFLKDLVHGCYKGHFSNITVLGVCRSGLCPIDERLFNRRMKIDGFTIDEGLTYVEKFYNEIWRPKDDNILEYIKKNRQELEHVLTNPLCAHIFSVVTADGTLTLTKGKILRKKELFQAMEMTMKKRQQEKNSRQFEDDASRFYNMCMYTLLLDIRTFDESVFELFQIDENHAYMIFMATKEEEGSRRKQWKFNHETFHEYFAACALEALPADLLSTFLLILCYRKEFRNTQRLLFSALGAEYANTKTLSDMIRATLLIQHERTDDERPHSKIGVHTDRCTEEITLQIDETELQETELSDIKQGASALCSYNPLEVLLPTDRGMPVDALDNDTRAAAAGVWQDITSFYEDKAARSQECGLFYSIIQKNTNYALIRHLYECLNEVPEELHSELFDHSIGCLLPSKQNERGVTVLKTGGNKWSLEEKNKSGMCVTSSSLKDMADAFKHQQQNDQVPTQTLGVLQLKIETQRSDMLSYLLKPWGKARYKPSALADEWSALLASIVECQTHAWKLHIDLDEGDQPHADSFLNCLTQNTNQDLVRQLLVPRAACCYIREDIFMTRGRKPWKTKCVRRGAVGVVMRQTRDPICKNMRDFEFCSSCLCLVFLVIVFIVFIAIHPGKNVSNITCKKC